MLNAVHALQVLPDAPTPSGEMLRQLCRMQINPSRNHAQYQRQPPVLVSAGVSYSAGHDQHIIAATRANGSCSWTWHA